ncbi:MAG: biotin/lipoyl-binding protein [Bryobacteraceae bacterium]
MKSNVGGQVVELAVDEGDAVKAGQLIARIDPSDSVSSLNQAKADYSSSIANVNQSRQALSMQRLQTAANIESAEQGLESSKERLAQAIALLREGTEILRTGGGCQLEAAHCHVLFDEIERLRKVEAEARPVAETLQLAVSKSEQLEEQLTTWGVPLNALLGALESIGEGGV